ncbi:pentatricopeptide repeat-containing protein At5g18475-like [Phalaenopsis equestris]|uniref:pentatricopeptide repeat-containing protein At5g18475-like n=1 Tax=Phalaenopsis equestris TaxID=78828 RepID=UPI0009E5236B|nr:pentatricopeptide repeat-containing protein At5g18475-like [Phalaenopsis equestris]
MASQSLRRKPSFPPSSSSSSSPSFPWISPLQYLKPTSQPRTPPPQAKSADSPAGVRRSRFISHADAVRLIIQKPDPQQSLDLFNFIATQPGFSHNHSTYAALLLRLARARLFPAVDAVLRRAASEPCRFHESLLISLMSQFSRSFLHEKVLEAFLLILPITRSKPSNKALSTCLNLLVEAGRIDLVQKLLSDVKTKLNLEPNTCTLNILVKLHCRSSDLASAFHLLEEMRQSKSSTPNLITYSTLIGALCSEGRLKDAFQLFEEMIERGRIVPDPLTYNLLIDGFCRHDSVEKAKTILVFMRNNGCEPNKFNYSTLMNGFCREGKLEEVKQLFNEMQSAGQETDAVCYTTLINCLCKAGEFDEGIELVTEMRDSGCKADVVTYNVLIEGLCRGGRVGEAMVMLERLPREGVRLNVASYRIVMNCILGNGDVDRAVGLLGLMLVRGVLPHYAASNKLLLLLCEVERLVDATVALFGLAEMGFLPEIGTWLALAGVACRERKIKRVIELIDDLVGGAESD